MAALGQPPKAQFFDINGFPLASGKAYAQIDIVTPVITYMDPAKTIYNQYPILLDGRGEAGIWSNETSYRLDVYDVNNNLVTSYASYPPAPPAKATFYDEAGEPLVGGKVYTYEAGTTTPQATYTDSTGAYTNPNPVILDARGEAARPIDDKIADFVRARLPAKAAHHLTRWKNEIEARPAVKRGRMVNRTSGKPEEQLLERHDAGDFKTKAI